MQRRSFLKLAGAAAAAVVARPGFAIFDEPIIDSSYARWVRDAGDWLEIFVPAGEVLRSATFDKPVLLILGRGAIFADCSVRGFVNCYAPQGGQILGSRFDSSGMLSKYGARPVLELVKAESMVISHCYFECEGAAGVRDSGCRTMIVASHRPRCLDNVVELA